MIDPIKVKEGLRQAEDRIRGLSRSADAGKALLWFEQCSEENGTGLVVVVKGVASSVIHHKEAEEYMKKAAAEFYGAIRQRAVALAKVDYEAGLKKGFDPD